MNVELFALLEQTIKKGSVLTFEPMKNHTTFKVGGEADVFVTPGSIEEAEEVIRLLCVKKETFCILGNGSNVLVSDNGIKGIVICLEKGCDGIECKDNIITAQAGALLSTISKVAKDHSLKGLEFASGIPGSLGGAVFMNAGAYGGEMSQVVKSVKMIDLDTGNMVIFSGEDMQFSYRHSIAKEKRYAILEAKIILNEGDPEDILKTMNSLNQKRREKQPLEYPSAGSTFKRPEGYFAGKLIEDAGLSGYTVGGAQVSEKHCGFVINRGDATASDIIQLIKDVRNAVMDKFGVELQPEVCMLGEDIQL